MTTSRENHSLFATRGHLTGRQACQNHPRMGLRGLLHTLAVPAALLASLLGCSSQPLDSCSNVGAVREPFTRKCLPQSFDPITDEANPSYGNIAAVLSCLSDP
jgi:hypothetical protein